MRNVSSIRSIVILVGAAITIWMVFNEGTVTAVLFAGFFFFLGSLVEVFQRREKLERRQLILYTVTYTLCAILIVLFLLWRYRFTFLR
jgi:hypothetical protein